MSGAAEQTEEVIRIDGRFLIRSLHVVGLAEVERNEGSVRLPLGKNTFIHIEYQQFIEIQQTCLEYTHDLYVRDGFAMERHSDILHRTPHEQAYQFARNRYIA